MLNILKHIHKKKIMFYLPKINIIKCFIFSYKEDHIIYSKKNINILYFNEDHIFLSSKSKYIIFNYFF